MKRVLIIESQMNQYRVPFYTKLHQALSAQSIQLTVAYSDPIPSEAIKNDTCDLPQEFGMKVPGHWFWKEKLLFQPLLRTALGSELVVVEQANKFVLNHVLLPLSRLGLRRIAFWGLGENRQDGRIGISEWYRRKTINWVSWWFAYTRSSAGYLARAGVPQDRITVVQNAIDSQELQSQVAQITEEEVAETKARLALESDACIGIYCGMLHRVKSLPFLLESAERIQRAIPNFHLLVVGGGPEQEYVDAQARKNAWLRSVGPRFGREKAKMLRLADVALLPGRVGLVILDCFAAGLPLLTTQIPIHGPEIDYLEAGVNGLVTAHDPASYADAAIDLLLDKERLSMFRKASANCSGKYSIDTMAENFFTGICNCLDVPPAVAPTVSVHSGNLIKRQREAVPRNEAD
jgi:glycosyltransferase involved in cell wall biosynthesis